MHKSQGLRIQAQPDRSSTHSKRLADRQEQGEASRRARAAVAAQAGDDPTPALREQSTPLSDPHECGKNKYSRRHLGPGGTALSSLGPQHRAVVCSGCRPRGLLYSGLRYRTIHEVTVDTSRSLTSPTHWADLIHSPFCPTSWSANDSRARRIPAWSQSLPPCAAHA